MTEMSVRHKGPRHSTYLDKEALSDFVERLQEDSSKKDIKSDRKFSLELNKAIRGTNFSTVRLILQNPLQEMLSTAPAEESGV